VRPRIGRCYNQLGRHDEALTTLEPLTAPAFERGVALAELTDNAAAEREFRGLLLASPDHRPALRRLARILRREGRMEDLAALCEELHSIGVGNAMLLYVWGEALALTGRPDRARALLFNRPRVAELQLPLPDGFSDHATYNAALADELLSNPHGLGSFPEHEPSRGSRRLHALFAGERPQLLRSLLDALQRLAAEWLPARYREFDPWYDARPARARLTAWGLIQSGSNFEEWHLHPTAWLSGVYYIRVPHSVTAAGEGPGCIEFGPPATLQRALPDYMPNWRYAPREGSLLLAPSHYAHRTIPNGADGYRISFAFDVVPERAGDAEEDRLRPCDTRERVKRPCGARSRTSGRPHRDRPAGS
jgi:hypothetical protein